MTQVKTIIKWALGLLILIGGIKTLTEGRPIGLFHVAFGLFFLPPVLSFVESKMKIAVPRVAKYVIAVGGFVAIGLIETNFQKGVSGPYLQKANEWIETGNLDSAMRYVKLAKQVFPDSVANPAFTQGREIQLFQSEDFYIQSMAELSQAEADQLDQGKLTKKFFENNTLNNRFNERLNQAGSKRLGIIGEYTKRKSIKSQFGDDGAHINLQDLIQKAMKDPKATTPYEIISNYSHIKTTYVDENGMLTVKTEFEGNSPYQKKLEGYVVAKVGYDGVVIEVVESKNLSFSIRDFIRINCFEKEQLKMQTSPIYAGAWAAARERYQYYIDAKDPRFTRSDIESQKLDSTIFFTQDNNSCLVMALQLTSDPRKPDKIFVFGGKKVEGTWKFFIHKRYYDTKKDLGFANYPLAYRLKELHHEAILTILSEGETTGAQCAIDENFWFGSIWMTP